MAESYGLMTTFPRACGVGAGYEPHVTFMTSTYQYVGEKYASCCFMARGSGLCYSRRCGDRYVGSGYCAGEGGCCDRNPELFKVLVSYPTLRTCIRSLVDSQSKYLVVLRVMTVRS